MNKKQVIKHILQTLGRQSFADWYGEGGRFDTWIQDSQAGVTEEQIRTDIEKLFALYPWREEKHVSSQRPNETNEGYALRVKHTLED